MNNIMVMVTRVEESKQHALLEKQDYGYIYIKCDYVMKYMKGANRLLTNVEGQNLRIKEMRGYQLAFYLLVNIDEWLTAVDLPDAKTIDSVVKKNSVREIKKLIEKQYKIEDAFKWWYKPEVTFTMPKSEEDTPVPHLIKKPKEIRDKNRRHSNAWAGPMVIESKRARIRRRPDLIIVKNQEIKWPGRAIEPQDSLYNESYEDNLKRLVEMKFPGDSLSRDQEDDYFLIATEDRLSVIYISQDANEESKVFTPEFVPAFATKNLPDPFKLEKWLHEGVRPIDLIGEESEVDLAQSYNAETIETLNEISPWLTQKGEFTATETTIRWQSEDGTTIEHPKAEVHEAMEALNSQMDISEHSKAEVLPTINLHAEPAVLPTLSFKANPPVPDKVSVSMTTNEKLVLAAEVGTVLISIFVPEIGLARLALLGYRYYKATKVARVAGAM